MSVATLFRRNLAVLRPYLGKAAIDVLRTYKNQSVHVIGEPGTPTLNMATPSGPVYHPNAHEYCSGQVQRFLGSPRRITLPDHLTCAERRGNLAAVIAAHISGMDFSRYDRQPAHFDSVAALVSFGLGLGVHIEELYSKLPCRDLVILEPEFEFFVASLHAIDWVPIVELSTKRKGKIYFLFDDDSRASFDALSMILRDRSYGLIEGSYLFDHYKHESFPAVVNKLYESGANLLSYNGWVEDEVTHVVNHIENTARNVRKLLINRDPGEAEKEKNTKPAVIVGSGPSLNDTISLIRNHRDKITLFSAGTSLGPLLKAGLKPDFHCELENVDVVPDIIRNLKTKFDMSGITLVASTTVDPNVPLLFDDCVFFLREGDGLLRALAGTFEQIQLVGPSGVNTAVTVARILGYQRLFLFGADFGVPNQGPQYASGVAYENIAQINTVRKGKGLSLTSAGGSILASMNRSIAGNAGVDVRSNDTLIGMLHRLEATIRIQNLEVFTVGRGAAIAGSQPCDDRKFSELVGNLSPASRSTQSDAVIELSQGALFDASMIIEIETGFRKLFADLADDLDALVQSETPLMFEQVYDQFTKYMYFPLAGNAASGSSAIRAAMTGSLLRIAHMIRSHCARVSEKNTDQFLRDALGIVQGMGIAWPEIVLHPISAKRQETVERVLVPDTILQSILGAVRHSRTDYEWKLDAAFAEMEDREGWRVLARYILKENIIYRLHNDRDWPAFDKTLVPLVHTRLMDESTLDLFLFPALAYLSVDPDLPEKTEIIDDVQRMLAQRLEPGLHLLFYAGVFFMNAGRYQSARSYAERVHEKDRDDAGAARLYANALLLAGEAEKALALYRSTAGDEIVLRVVCAVVDLEAVAVAIAKNVDEGIEFCQAQRLVHPGPNMIACVEHVLKEVQAERTGGRNGMIKTSDLDQDYLSIVRRIVLDAIAQDG